MSKIPEHILARIDDYVVGTSMLMAGFLKILGRKHGAGATKDKACAFISQFLDDVLDQLAGKVKLPRIWFSNQEIYPATRVNINMTLLGDEWKPLFEYWDVLIHDPVSGVSRPLSSTTIGELFVVLGRFNGDPISALNDALEQVYTTAAMHLACDLAFIIDGSIGKLLDDDGLAELHTVKLGALGRRKRKRMDRGPTLIR